MDKERVRYCVRAYLGSLLNRWMSFGLERMRRHDELINSLDLKTAKQCDEVTHILHNLVGYIGYDVKKEVGSCIGEKEQKQVMKEVDRLEPILTKLLIEKFGR